VQTLPPGKLVGGAPPVPLEPPAPLLASGLPGFPPPHVPLVQTPLAHSFGDAQLLPAGSIVPLPQVPLLHVPLEQSEFVVQMPPAGAPNPPTHAPLLQLPLTQSLLVEQLTPGPPRPLLLSDEPHE